MERQYYLIDKLCLEFDQFLRALAGHSKTSSRACPTSPEKDKNLSQEERKHSAALMRVNHAGEICAQALYHGQAAISRDKSTREKLQQAAIEEGDHLAWCNQRIKELDSHTSYLNPFWYFSSYLIGMIAGIAGDHWSLGFVAETEKQVVNHLQEHLQQLPQKDHHSYTILKQMQADEEKHGQEALKLGGSTLPRPIQACMHWVSKIMVKTAYWI